MFNRKPFLSLLAGTLTRLGFGNKTLDQRLHIPPDSIDIRGMGGRNYKWKRPPSVPKQRLKPAAVGGNWQGKEYLTYAEHDAICRSYLAAPHIPRNDPVHYEIALSRMRGKEFIVA